MTDDNNDIPPFLRRTLPPGVTLNEEIERSMRAANALPATRWMVEAQRYVDAATEAEVKARDKDKSYTRLARMKDRQAVRAGQTWDAEKGRWVMADQPALSECVPATTPTCNTGSPMTSKACQDSRRKRKVNSKPKMPVRRGNRRRKRSGGDG
jgi:hypothetical protein